MKNWTVKIMSLLILLAAFQLSSCMRGGDPSPDAPRLDRPLELAPLFYYADRISVPPYSYQDIQTKSFFRIRGDSSIIDIIDATKDKNASLNLLPFDTVSQMPTLRWEKTNKKLVSAAIFEARIESGSDGIMNPDKIVWLWNSTLSSENDINYEKGRMVLDGSIQYNLPAAPLVKGKAYYWAAWAWDDKGLNIVQSTAEQIFIVKND